MKKMVRGSAPVLGFFSVFVIITSLAAVYIFEEGYREQLDAMERRIALETTRAMSETLERELNQALRTSVEASMYEVGRAGGDRERVLVTLREYFNQRIGAGWSYPNFDIVVPLSDENSLKLVWLPDGSLMAAGYLDAVVTHISGTRGFGVELSAGVVPRYGRMYYLANKAYEEALSYGDLEDLERRYNTEYSCELLTFYIERVGGRVRVTVKDDFAGRALA
ncbi:MAG: hypothetical protein QXG10_00340 [Candidatus Hadarchaeales archaeon]